MALFMQNQGLWYCCYSTVAIAVLAAFGMGLSVRVRANVMLMVPMLCSANGKKFLLFLIATLLLQGPVANTLGNFERAADSVVCGAELAMNHTQELMKRAAAPLLSVLDNIKEITRNAHSVAGRVQNLIKALTENVRHVARTLRNVLHFLVDIGDTCNNKMGTPYRKCTEVFDEAREDCTELLGIFNFLCHIVDGFRPLCGLARAGQLFCVIPSYIASHLKKRLAAPTIAAFERMKQEFEFNISASFHFDVDFNSSQSLQQVSQEIIEEVSAELGRFQKLRGLLAYVGLYLLAVMYLQAVLYKYKYLHQDAFDNTYITEQFEELDDSLANEGKPTVLPLTQREARNYIRPLSVYLTVRERRDAALGVASMLRHVAMGGLVMALDLLVFWTFDLVHHQAQGDIITRAPVIVAVQVNGSGYASDIFKDILASFNILQNGNITVLSKKCLMEASKPDYTGYVMIGILYGLTLFITLAGRYVRRFRRLVCASYHPRRERERIQLLHVRILNQRMSLSKALLRSVARSKADGTTDRTSLLHTLLLRVPGGSYLADLLGVTVVRCMACGKEGEEKNHNDMVACGTEGEEKNHNDMVACGTEGEEKNHSDMVACVVPQCKGLYCRPCFQQSGNICALCSGTLTFQEDSEEELDSSDDEQGSPTASHRKLMKRRISVANRQSEPDMAYQDCTEADEPDMAYQDCTEADEPDMAYQDCTEADEPDMADQDCTEADEPDMADQDCTEADEPDMADQDCTEADGSDCSLDGPLRMVTVHQSSQQTPQLQPQPMSTGQY